MQIKDINSSVLLPRFASKTEWVCNALDDVIKSIRVRTDAIDAPLTMESIEVLTDDEIRYYFEQIGVIKYYPDIPRPIKNEILFNLYRLQPRLGTPRTVEILCQYVFKDIDLFIEIFDNLAFNSLGELIDESLLDLFDVTVHPSTNSLEQDFITRLYKNIFALSRNSQTIRNLNIEYQSNNINTSACIALPYDDIEGVEYVYNYDLCESVIIEDHLYFGGDFSGNNIRMESVDGGGGLIEKYASYKSLFNLRGWEPGGLFIDKPQYIKEVKHVNRRI